MESIKEQVLKEIKEEIGTTEYREGKIWTIRTEALNRGIKKAIDLTIKKTEEQILKEIDKIPNKELAELFHNKYEETSRLCGWNTQDKCKVKFKDLPKPNRNTMLITIAEIKKHLKKRLKANPLEKCLHPQK